MAVCFFLLVVVFFVSLTLFYSVLLHACWTVPMMVSLPASCSDGVCGSGRVFYVRETSQNNGRGQRARKAVLGPTKMMSLSGIFCTVFIMLSFISEMSLTLLLLLLL